MPSATLNFEPGAAIVAGGSGGIGAAITRRLAACGLPVVFTWHSDEAKAKALRDEIAAAGGTCEAVRADLANPGQVQALFERAQRSHGPVAQVVYAAGPHFAFNYIGEIPDAEWHRVIDTDVNGAFHVIQSAVRSFRASGGGNLVAVITCAVERTPLKDVMSAAPKAAIEMIVRGVAKESGRFGIRANCVGPGWIYAGLGKKGLDEKLDERQRADTLHQIPLRRFGEADDIAQAVLFLCSREANYITGQSLAVDGGMQV